jgi:hypothetical protein
MQIYHNRSLKRLTVTPLDVMAPLFGMLSLNVLVLIVWTVLSPLRWERVHKASFDEFGRTRESYGSCMATEPGSTACMVVLMVVNAMALVVANVQAHRARNITTDFSESRYIKTAAVFILQGKTKTHSMPGGQRGDSSVADRLFSQHKL